MSDRDRLQAVLGKLSDSTPLPVPDPASAQTALTGLLRAIDETVLARDLRVEIGDTTVVLTVAKRRLLTVSGAVEAQLSEADETALTDLGTKLADLMVGKSLTLTAKRPENAPDPSAVGASVGALAAAWAEAAAGGPGILDLAESAAAAVVWADDEITFGDARLLSEISVDRDAIKGGNGQGWTAIQGPERWAAFVWTPDAEALLIGDDALMSELSRFTR